MGVFMTRREIILIEDGSCKNFGSAVLRAYESGMPVQHVFEQFNVEFNQLLSGYKLEVYHDAAFDGVEEMVLHNGGNSLMYIRPNGIVKITFRNNDAIKGYEHNGIFKVLTKHGSKRQNRRLTLNNDNLQPYFLNGGECR